MRCKLLLILFVVACFLPKGWGQLPLGDNLVVNGDFENGNTGFLSQYSYFTSTLPNPGACHYCVDTDASSHYGSGSGQPWKGNGNDGQGQYNSNSRFLMASGGYAGQYVWRSTVNVKPNTDYEFEAWVCHLYKLFGDTYRAQVKFTINGVEMGVQQAPNHRNGYIQFSHAWNSGSATTAEISIYDINTNTDAGNDFGLDDISLRERLVMDPISMIAPVCAGSSLALTPPEVYCEGCSGRWEVVQGNTVVFNTTSNTLTNIPVSWNGCHLRYAVQYQGSWHYSNEVQIYVTQNLGVEIQIIDGDAVMCEADTAVLHAAVTNDVMNFDFISVGDILCTDGSIVHPANWASSGKTAKGIVFYVDSTDVHGWALGLTGIRVKWSNANGSISGLQNIPQARAAIRDFQGLGNTGHINSSQYPAAKYCIDKGGYLPSIGQLNILFGGLAIVNESLELVGGMVFPATSGWFLWSSTVQANDKAYCIERSGKIDTGSKMTNGTTSVPKIARPVFDF